MSERIYIRVPDVSHIFKKVRKKHAPKEKSHGTKKGKKGYDRKKKKLDYKFKVGDIYY